MYVGSKLAAPAFVAAAGVAPVLVVAGLAVAPPADGAAGVHAASSPGRTTAPPAAARRNARRLNSFVPLVVAKSGLPHAIRVLRRWREPQLWADPAWRATARSRRTPERSR